MSWLLAIGLALAGVASSAEDGVVWKTGFGRAALWNDGNAEVSVYRARDVKYGAPRDSSAILIVVAEDELRDRMVKPDKPVGEPTSRRVLKLNHIRSIQTGVYTYQQMLSVFAGADRLDPVKLTVASHEWCGNSFVEWRADRPTLSIRSYFENPGDVDVRLAADGALFFDALPLVLRGLDFEKTRGATIRVIDSVFTNRPLPPPVELARLDVSRSTRAEPAYRVTLRRGERVDVFEFGVAFPHPLLRWERSDGGSLELTDSRRYRYWEKHNPGDERFGEPSSTR